MKVDFLIVGGGLSGSFFALEALDKGASLCVFDNGRNKASSAAAGIVNPVALKRFNPVWNINNLLRCLQEKREMAIRHLGKDYFIPLPIHRVLSNEKEKQTWLKKSEREDLKDYLTKSFDHVNPSVYAQNGMVSVAQTGRWNVESFLRDISFYLEKNEIHRTETFNYQKLIYEEGFWNYDDIRAKHILFCEGIGIKKNPYFSSLPIYGIKGESLRVEFKNLEGQNLFNQNIYKAKAFVSPISKREFYVGGTHERNFLSEDITQEARNLLLEQLNEMIAPEIKIVSQKAGIRPSIKDHKPVVGEHRQRKGLFLINGMGARGVLMSSFCSGQLNQYIQNGTPINPEISVKRFYHLDEN